MKNPASTGQVGRATRPVALTTRGRCLLAGGVATAACAGPLDERDLLRVGAVVALLPLLALALAAVAIYLAVGLGSDADQIREGDVNGQAEQLQQFIQDHSE